MKATGVGAGSDAVGMTLLSATHRPWVFRPRLWPSQPLVPSSVASVRVVPWWCGELPAGSRTAERPACLIGS